MSDPISDFYKWLLANAERYSVSNAPYSEVELDELCNQLHAIDPAIFFQLGGVRRTGPTELILTAEGVVEKFELIKSMVLRAPKIPDWRLIALKPPSPDRFVTRFEGITIDPSKVRFMLMESTVNAGSYGLQVEWPSSGEKEGDVIAGLHIAVDSLLGEECSARYIRKIWCVQVLPGSEPHLHLTDLLRIIRGRQDESI